MHTAPNRLLHTASALGVALFLLATPARAQFQARPLDDGPIGERYHIEFATGLWMPNAAIAVSSESLGIIGSTIDAKEDLGLVDRRVPELHLELRAATRHKFRFQYIPLKYEQTATLTRDIVFNGQRYRLGVPVASMLDWKAGRAGYQYDFITHNRLWAGFVADFKITDVTVNLATQTNPSIVEYVRATAPIPALGGAVRGYVTPNVSITGEVTGFKLPKGVVKDSTGHYVDVDIYGTANFTNNVGVQVGFRSFNVGYLIEQDTGSFTVKGLFFGIVARY